MKFKQKFFTALQAFDTLTFRLGDRNTISVFRRNASLGGDQLRWTDGDDQFLFIPTLSIDMVHQLMMLIGQLCNLSYVVNNQHARDTTSPRIMFTMLPNTRNVYVVKTLHQETKSLIVEHVLTAGWGITENLGNARFVIGSETFPTTACEEAKIYILGSKTADRKAALRLRAAQVFDYNLKNLHDQGTTLLHLLQQTRS